MTKLLSVTEDLRTMRLLKTAQAMELAGLLPDTSAKVLVRHARSVRLLCEAGERGLAGEVLDRILQVCSEESESKAAVASLRAHVGHIRKVL